MSMYCPYCLTQQSFSQQVCGNCNRDVSREYINNARVYPPVWLATLGFPGHGKTNAINSMTLHIENISKVCPSAYYNYLDDHTVHRVGEIRREAMEGKVDVESTPQGDEIPEPLIIGLDEFPEQRTNTLVIYDLSGEAATNPKENYIRAIQHAKTAWFVISLNDLREGTASRNDLQPRTINDLFMTYRKAMEESINAPLHGRTILVNYTKSDLLRNDNSLPEIVQQYMSDDDWFYLANNDFFDFPSFNETPYKQKMKEISAELRRFTQTKVQGGASFISQAERKYGMHIEFCITSATGGGDEGVDIQRHRVLDPLLWAIYLNDRVVDKTINTTLITDVTLYANDYPAIVYNVFSSYGANITTYHLGEKSKKFDSGQAPKPRSSNANIPLIGPVIDTLDTEKTLGKQIIILLLKDVTPLDLNDFKFTEWEDYIHIITTQADIATGWANRTILESADMDLGSIIDSLIKNQSDHK